MKILKIIHGYPPLYNAGSEVYSQLLCLGLAKKHEVHVFTREENPFMPDFQIRESIDGINSAIKLHIINIPLERNRYKFMQPEVDNIFEEILQKIKPDIVHIGHLNHLSTSIITVISNLNIPIVYTLHDYWLMCPRGQFIQRNAEEKEGLWSLCSKQDNRKCAEKCYSGYFTGIPNQESSGVDYWTDWVAARMQHIREITSLVDRFIAPSKYLYNRYVKEFQLLEEKVTYLDYGFDLNRLKNRKRESGKIFTFGYIGTHIPAKGIQHLIKAFERLNTNCQLKIWGRSHAQSTEALKAIAEDFSPSIQKNIFWMNEYPNEDIVEKVFNHVDCIVVPSIWVENSPLVIHEALQARVPVITADVGGMAEYVKHEENGLLFQHRNIKSLSEQMQRLVDNPDLANVLGMKGYLQSDNRNIPDLDLHTDVMNKIYQQLIKSKGDK